MICLIALFAVIALVSIFSPVYKQLYESNLDLASVIVLDINDIIGPIIGKV